MLRPITLRIESLFYGVTLPVRALRLILSRKKLLGWAAFPIALTLALSVWGVTWLKAKLMAYGIHWMASFGLAPESITVQAAMLFLQILLFVLAAISFSFLATILASPFNDFLSEATEPYCTPRLPILPSEASRVAWKIRSVWIDIVKTILVTLIQLILIAVSLVAIWIPGLNLIPFILAFWLLTFQFVSYPQTRRGEGFRHSIRFLSRHAFASLGFGAAIGALFAIPFISAFALPLAVVGGTLLYARAADPLTPLK